MAVRQTCIRSVLQIELSSRPSGRLWRGDFAMLSAMLTTVPSKVPYSSDSDRESLSTTSLAALLPIQDGIMRKRAKE